MNDMIVGSFANPQPWVQYVFGSSFGWDWDWEDGREERRLTAERALTYAPLWYGANKIGGHIAQLPIHVFKRLERGAEREREHNVAKVMRRPNPYQSSVVFRELVAVNSLLDGNGRAVIVRNGSRVVEPLPLYPDRTVTVMIDGEKIHGSKPPEHDRVRKFFKSEDDSADGWLIFDDADVLHIPGLSLNGITGISLRQLMSRNVGASINAEVRLAKQMEYGFNGSVVIEAPPNAFRNQKDAEEFLEAFEKRHHNKQKSGKPALVREGMKLHFNQTSNKDAEMIENRRFQRQDAALYLGLESILGDDQSVSYNSLEQKNLAYLMNCLNRWLKRWEEEMEYKLLPRRQYDSESHFIRFNTAALLKSDFQSTVSALNTLVTGTILTRNEAREVIDRNPMAGGDVLSNPAITPGPSTEPAEEEDGREPMDAAARRAINSRLSHLIGVESNNLVQAARNATEKGKNYLDWVEKYYAENWEHKLAETLEELGIDRDEATQYCSESKRRIVEVCDYSTQDNLAENVAKCVSTWKNRANSIGNDNVQC